MGSRRACPCTSASWSACFRSGSAVARARKKKQILVQIDPDLLARLDHYAAEWTGANRSRAIAQAVDTALAAHAAWNAAQAPPPFVGHDPGGARHTADL